jgi:predicted CopG family antitoxin
LEAYRKILEEKNKMNCSVSDVIVRLIKEQKQPQTAELPH